MKSEKSQNIFLKPVTNVNGQIVFKIQLRSGLRILIRIILGSWFRIRPKAGIRRYIGVSIEVKIQELLRLKMPCRAVDAHNEGVEALNGVFEGLQTSSCGFASL
jgi:hypothetical protein